MKDQLSVVQEKTGITKNGYVMLLSGILCIVLAIPVIA